MRDGPISQMKDGVKRLSKVVFTYNENSLIKKRRQIYYYIEENKSDNDTSLSE